MGTARGLNKIIQRPLHSVVRWWESNSRLALVIGLLRSDILAHNPPQFARASEAVERLGGPMAAMETQNELFRPFWKTNAYSVDAPGFA